MPPPPPQTEAFAEQAPVVLGPLPLARAARWSGAWMVAKRVFDVVFTSLMLLGLAPLLLLVAAAIKLDSRGPVLFRQRRLGREMRPFTVFKFRTMHDGVSSAAHQAYIAELVNGNGHGHGNGNGNGNGNGLKKLTEDPRVTRVGKLLRRFSLDELPQLFNVMGGSMSLIGPRPALDYELAYYRIRQYERFLVRPGLSGLWQVSGRNQLGFVEMLDLDVEYAHRSGPALDAKIFLRTPLAMVRDCA